MFAEITLGRVSVSQDKVKRKGIVVIEIVIDESRNDRTCLELLQYALCSGLPSSPWHVPSKVERALARTLLSGGGPLSLCTPAANSARGDGGGGGAGGLLIEIDHRTGTLS